MPDLRSDFVGRVNRLPLRPSDKTALAPLMEAVSNSVYAITERYGDRAGKQGRIDIAVIRDLEAESPAIVGFEISDNGVGFNQENYESFLTPDSRLKERKGGKGVGRLAWLKVFRTIDVDSVFHNGTEVQRRKFNFVLREHDQVVEQPLETLDTDAPLKTTIRFVDFDDRFRNRAPSKPGVVPLRILSHFVPLFLAGNAPQVVVHDGEVTNIESLLTDNIVDQHTEVVDLDFDGENVKLEIWSIKARKAIRFEGGGFNFGFINAHNRAVIEYSMDEQIGLQSLEGEYVYLASASSAYLDDHVNAERTAFTLDANEIDQVKRAMASAAKNFLRPYIEHVLTEKVRVTREVITENPQFLFVEENVRGFVEGLQPNVKKKEEIFLELARTRFRRIRSFSGIEKEIRKAHVFDNEIRAKIEDYQKFISLEKKGALAEYVSRRKAVLDLLEKFLEYTDAIEGTYEREEAVHQLICPMKIDSGKLSLEDHNLWLLDDRLSFFHFFASDKPASSYAGVDSLERPDLAFFFDTCVAWREAENTDTVVLVEFKKPMRDDYSGGRDPVQQVLHYVKLLREEKAVPDVKGRSIRGISKATAFHCYVVADLTPTLENSIIGRFSPTPDGAGYFGYSATPPAFVEVIPYGKILHDAKARNAIFFKTLGITESGEAVQ